MPKDTDNDNVIAEFDNNLGQVKSSCKESAYIDFEPEEESGRQTKSSLSQFNMDYRESSGADIYSDTKPNFQEFKSRRSKCVTGTAHIPSKKIFIQESFAEEYLSQEEYVDVQGRKKNKNPKRLKSIPKGVIVIGVALAGIVSLVCMAGNIMANPRSNYTNNVPTSHTELTTYDSFLTPVVIQDPEPFETIDNADPQMIITVGLWDAILSGDKNQHTSFDEKGRELIPLDRVSNSCFKIFGPNCKIEPNTLENQTFVEFDNNAKQFHISPISTQNSCFPCCVNEEIQEDITILKVGYVSSAEEWKVDPGGRKIMPTPVKYMEYKLKTDPSTGQKYIQAIRSL